MSDVMVSSANSVATLADTWDVERIRADFPVLHQKVNGKPLVYLDNGASSQVPQVVIDRGSVYIEQEHSNIHRGVHYLSQRATTAYEGAREKVKRFINARESRECIFVRGATEGINLVMHVGPRALTAVRSLRNHICHQVSFLIDWNAVLVIAISIWSHVTAVKACREVVC